MEVMETPGVTSPPVGFHDAHVYLSQVPTYLPTYLPTYPPTYLPSLHPFDYCDRLNLPTFQPPNLPTFLPPTYRRSAGVVHFQIVLCTPLPAAAGVPRGA
jgi:hypothetical protein